MNETKVIRRPAVGYDKDFQVWSSEQAAHLRALKPKDIDWENVAEEIESLGKSDRRSIASDLRAILEHLLKWKYQPEKRKTGWRSSIREHRDRIERIVADSPSLAPYPAERLAAEYPKARRAALEDTGLPAGRIPAACPFRIEQILDPDYFPN